MTSETVRKTLGWSAVINMGLLLFFAMVFLVAKDWIFSVWGIFFDVSNEQYELFMLYIMAIWKILVFVFLLIPYLAIRIVEKRK